ncbi:hypothetical protein Tco_1370511 [Tanacetum coccineum]
MAPLPPRDQRHLWLHYQVDLAETMGRRIGDEMGLDVAGLHTAEEMEEDGFGAYWLGSERVILDKGDLSDYWVEISSGRDFLRGAPSYTYIRDLVRRLCHSMDRGAANVPYLLAQYLFRHAEGRKSGASLLSSTSVLEIGDDWAWVAPGLERQQVAAAGAPKAVEDTSAVDEGAQADPAPLQAP